MSDRINPPDWLPAELRVLVPRIQEAVLAGAVSAEAFDVTKLGEIAKSPLRLRDWLDLHIPWLVGPHIDQFEPTSGQRGTIVTLRGARFASTRSDNLVTIGGASAPVLSASSTELKVLTTADTNTGQIQLKIGTHTAAGPYPFTVIGYPGDANDDGPPVFAMGAGAGSAGDVNPIGTIRVLIVVCQALDLVPANFNTVRTGLNDRWTNVQTFYTQASYGRTNVQFDIVGSAAQLDGNFTDFVDLPGIANIIPGQLNRIAAIAANHAQSQGFDPNNYQMMCSVVFTNNQFIRAWGGSDTSIFSYDDGKPSSDPTHIHISIPLAHAINLLWI